MKNANTEHHVIAKSMVTVALFVFFGKIIGACKEMLVAWRYGISPEVDAYLFVFNLANYPVTIFYGAVSAVLIPVAAQLANQSRENLAKFRAEIFGVTLLLGIIAFPITALLIQFLLKQGIFNLHEQQLEIAQGMVWPLALIIPFGWLASLWSCWTMFAKRQINTFFESMPALATLVLVYTWGGTIALIWGTVIGFFCYALFLAIDLTRKQEISFPRFTFTSSAWQTFRTAIAAVLLAQAFSTTAGLVDQFLAARLESGSISTLGYASRILSLVLSLGATAVGRAVLPVFSHAHANGTSNVSQMALKWSGIMLLAGAIITAIMIPLAPAIVGVLFERGAFTATDTANVAEVLRYALLQLPFSFAAIVTTYALHSKGLQRSVTKIAVTSFTLKAITSTILASIMGLNGLMLSTCLVMGIALIQTTWQLKRGE